MERRTKQRDAIVNAIVVAARPLSPHEILEAASSEMAALSIATVYRTLRVLLDEGSIDAIELPGEPPRYEEAALGHHHHFKCTACDRVFDVKACQISMKTLVPPDFSVDRHELTVYGLCGECNRSRSRRT